MCAQPEFLVRGNLGQAIIHLPVIRACSAPAHGPATILSRAHRGCSVQIPRLASHDLARQYQVVQAKTRARHLLGNAREHRVLVSSAREAQALDQEAAHAAAQAHQLPVLPGQTLVRIDLQLAAAAAGQVAELPALLVVVAARARHESRSARSAQNSS
jgi:hypothetical protein